MKWFDNVSLTLVFVGFFVWEKCGFALVGCLTGYGLALKKSYQSLQGMNGDISGFCICISELCAAFVLVLL